MQCASERSSRAHVKTFEVFKMDKYQFCLFQHVTIEIQNHKQQSELWTNEYPFTAIPSQREHSKHGAGKRHQQRKAHRDVRRDFRLFRWPQGPQADEAGHRSPGPVDFVTDDGRPRMCNDRLSRRSTLAVSLEPPGGSPTGQPTGPVIAAGKLANL
jgi:hypothetical protein